MGTGIATVIAASVLMAPARASVLPALDQAVQQAEEVVVVDQAGDVVRGRLISLSSDGLVLLVDGSRRQLPLARVTRVSRRGDSVMNGFIIGAVIGAVMGALSPADGVDTGGKRAVLIAASTGLYALVGAGIDGLHSGQTTIYASSPSATMSRRIAHRRLGARWTVRW
jgi:hypothetical protein